MRFELTTSTLARLRSTPELHPLSISESGKYKNRIELQANPLRHPKSYGKALFMTAIDPKLLEILVCPVTKSVLVYDEEAQELVSKEAGLAYPIRDGIPIMLPDEARKLEKAE